MNEETRNLLNRLERVTSPGDVDRNRLDEESAAMRESWLALSRLLSATESQPKCEVVVMRKAVPVQRKSWAWAVGIASSLVAVALWVSWWSDRGASPEVVVNEISPGIPSATSSSANDSPQSTSELTWDDDFEQDFDQLVSVVQGFHSTSDTGDSISQLQNEFSQLAEEFESGSL